MPSGRIHALASLGGLLAGGVGSIALGWWQRGWGWWFVAAYLSSAFLLSPDLDLPSNRSRRHWGLLGFLWSPYARLFRHRGVSHHWLLGPLTRAGYLFMLFVPVFLARPEWFRLVVEATWSHLVPLSLGLYVPHWLHIYLDAAFARR